MKWNKKQENTSANARVPYITIISAKNGDYFAP